MAQTAQPKECEPSFPHRDHAREFFILDAEHLRFLAAELASVVAQKKPGVCRSTLIRSAVMASISNSRRLRWWEASDDLLRGTAVSRSRKRKLGSGSGGRMSACKCCAPTVEF